MVKNPPANAGDTRDTGLIPGSGRSPGGRKGNPFQYSCLENPVDRGAWWATVHRVTKSWTQRKRLSTQCASTHTGSGLVGVLSYCSYLRQVLLRGKDLWEIEF